MSGVEDSTNIKKKNKCIVFKTRHKPQEIIISFSSSSSSDLSLLSE